MPYIVQQYTRGSRNALEAGFDGVEVHAANGYLLDQFINSGSNHRADGYGGAVQTGARLLMEVVEAMSDVWAQDRVGVRLSPLGTFNDMSDDDPETTFGHVAEKLNGGGLGIGNAGAGLLRQDVSNGYPFDERSEHAFRPLRLPARHGATIRILR